MKQIKKDLAELKDGLMELRLNFDMMSDRDIDGELKDLYELAEDVLGQIYDKGE